MKAQFILTAQTPISHHDPGVQNDSNMLTLNRRRQFIDCNVPDGEATQDQIDAICEAWPVPELIRRVIEAGGGDFTDFVAISFIRILIDMYGRGEGVGLFSGAGRYNMLESRLTSASTRAHNLRVIWDLLSADLHLPTTEDWQRHVLPFFALPATVQRAAVTAMVKSYRTIVGIAAEWVRQERMMNESYAEAADQMKMFDDRKVLSFDAAAIPENQPRIIAEIPAVSTNGLRHQMIRRPSWQLLCKLLDLHPDRDELPLHVEAIFENGGNIKSGASQPRGAYYYAQQIRDTYPSLELLGGVTNSFDIGESRLKMHATLICRENAGTLLNTIAGKEHGLDTSVFDMLDNVTHTRHATRHGEGQMIYNFEVLVPGISMLVEMTLDHFASERAASALIAGIDEYQKGLAFFGGQSARGYGYVSTAEHRLYDGLENVTADLYMNYVRENADILREGIFTGTLGSDAVVAT